MKLSNLLVTLAFAGAATAASANVVNPVSYTFDQSNSCGAWCNYFDPSFTKLTDGVLGTKGWAANQGQEWAGWLSKPVVNIDFTFANSVQISNIRIGTTQDNLGDVVIPSFNIYDWESGNWVLKGNVTVPASSANDQYLYDTAPHDFLDLSNLNINSQFVRVSALTNGPWIFVDEVQFESSNQVPEPGSYALLLAGLCALTLVAKRRKTL